MADGDVLSIVAGHQAFAAPTGGGTPTGFVLLSLLTDISGNHTIPAAGNFATIVMDSTYDNGGYYSATLPNGGVPGFLVPAAGDGLIHRVKLSATFAGLSLPASGEDSMWVMAAISPSVSSDIGDVRIFTSAISYKPNVGQGVTLSCEWTGPLSEDDEFYFYAKQISSAACYVNFASATIERLAVA
jgi:hypothetical protein